MNERRDNFNGLKDVHVDNYVTKVRNSVNLNKSTLATNTNVENMVSSVTKKTLD